MRDAGLMRRQTGFYVTAFVLVTACLAGAVTGSALLGDSWFQLLIAAALGVIFTQYAFLAHETAHKQVFESGRASERVGRLLAAGVVGMSYAWWMSKHTRHHGNPNTVGKDPDIAPDVIVFREEDAVGETGVARWFAHRQAYAFFPILLLEGINLHVTSYKTLVGRGRVDKRWHEIGLITARFAVYLGLLFWLLDPGMAFAFVGVQLGVFGLYMGASFAPNHKGMAMIPEGTRVDFLSKQVHTSTTLWQSYGIVVRYLNRVGLAAGGDVFDCPAATQLRPR